MRSLFWRSGTFPSSRFAAVLCEMGQAKNPSTLQTIFLGRNASTTLPGTERFWQKLSNALFHLRPHRQLSSIPDLCLPLSGAWGHWVVTEDAQWCKPDHPISSFDTPVASQPTKSQVLSTAPLLSSFLSEYTPLRAPAHEKCSCPPGRTPQDPGSHRPLSECSAQGRYTTCCLAPRRDISHTNSPVCFANLLLISTAWGQAAANDKCCVSRFFCTNYTELSLAWHRKWSHKFYLL